MKIKTFLWIGLAILSTGLFLASVPRVLYAEETHGGTRYMHADKKDTDRDDNNAWTNHRDSDHDSGGTWWAREHHDKDTREAKRHEFTTDFRHGDGRDIDRDRNERYDHREFSRGNVMIFNWGDTRDYGYDRLGTVWYESEGLYNGVWTRRGNSNVFDAVWTYGRSRVTAVLTIYLNGDDVTIYRRNGSDGYAFNYSGTLSGNETQVDGRVSGGPVVRAPWEATITGYQR